MSLDERVTIAPLRPARAEILAQLDRILASPPFKTSKRSSDLLRHVVQALCDGNVEFLKERTLGVAVFERDPEYDTNQDPVVRNTAVQVRKRLAQYYMEPGRDGELRLELPSGGYIPQVHQPVARASNTAVIEAEPPPAKLPERPPKPPRRRLFPLAIGALILAGLCAFALTRPRPKTSIELFWAPMIRQPGAVVLCVGQGHTYKLKGDLDKLFAEAAQSPEAASALKGSIPLTDVVPIWDRSIGIHDAQTLVRLTALLAGMGKPVEFRGGRSTSLGDLRGRSSILIGAFNNSWTLDLTGELRFYFDEDAAGKTFMVRDRLHPENHDWEVRGDQQTGQDHADYAIVSRVFNPTTEQAVLVAAGIQGGGTAAAGEFLTDSGYLEQALRGAPPHWETRNLQFVLKTRLLGGTAGPPQLVAAHYW